MTVPEMNYSTAGENTRLISKLSRKSKKNISRGNDAAIHRPRIQLYFAIILFLFLGTMIVMNYDQLDSNRLFSSFLVTEPADVGVVNVGEVGVDVINVNVGPTDDKDFFSAQGDDSVMAFTMARNGYKPLDYFSSDPSELFTYNALSGYDGILEPNADMDLYISNGYTDMLYYEYTVCDDLNCVDGVLSSSSGGGRPTSSVNIDCEPFTEYSIEVYVLTTDSGRRVDTQSGKLTCVYVRREIRGLTTSDLTNTLTAMNTLWTVSEEDGQELYGEDYHSIEYLTQMHHFGAAWQDGDHIHEGLGFLPQHIKITTIFEKAVQAVDGSVTVPYWDYTIETAAGQNIFNNEIFGPSTFGTVVSPGNSTYGWTYTDNDIMAGVIPDGLWANTKALMNTKYGSLQNGFGYLRGPWNMNPSPYLSRFPVESGTLPGCSSHYTLLTYDDMMTFLAEAPYGSHASTHGSIGGVFGCDEFTYLTDLGYINDADSQINLCANWGFYVKELYRANYIVPWSNCTYDADNINDFYCGFTCSADYDSVFAEKLEETISSSYVPSDMSSSGWSEWKNFICEGNAYKVFTGDHLESASPLDPSFWMIHPTQERLLHAKYMSGGFTNATWPTDQVNDFICSKGICYEADEGARGSYSQCCYGHNQYDQLMDFVSANKTAGYGLTNDFVIKANDPKSELYSMEYIYDSFAWPHCADENSDFNELLWSFYHRVADVDVPDDVPADVPTFSPTTSAPTPTPYPTAKPTNFAVAIVTQYTNIVIASIVSAIGLLCIFAYEYCCISTGKGKDLLMKDVGAMDGLEYGEEGLDDFDDFEEGRENESDEDDPNKLLFSFYKQAAEEGDYEVDDDDDEGDGLVLDDDEVDDVVEDTEEEVMDDDDFDYDNDEEDLVLGDDYSD